MQQTPKTLPTLGIIAGSGDLPERIIEACMAIGRSVFVIAFEGETTAASLHKVPHAWVNLSQAGKVISYFREAKAEEVILVGRVQRPASLTSLRLDITGLKLLARIMRSKLYGDNAIFSTVVQFLEEKGFKVVGVYDVLRELLAPKGVLGKIVPTVDDEKAIGLGVKAALTIGALDIGQAVVVQQHVILGVEALEGTDALIARTKDLKQEGRGPILVKVKKPKQESRIDLPTIGVTTIENAHQAGFIGVAVEAGGALIIDLDKVVEKANSLGIFVVGVDTAGDGPHAA